MALRTKQPATPTTPRPVLGHKRAWAFKFPGWSRRSIRARLQLSHLLTSLVPLLVLGFVLLFTSAEAERRIVEQTQKSVAGSIAYDMADIMAQSEYELLSFGRQPALSGSDRSAIESAASRFMSRNFPDMIDLAVLDLRGNEIKHLTQERVFFDSELTNRGKQPFFARASQGLIYRGILGAVNGEPVLQIAVPARNSIGQVASVVVAELSTQQLEQRLAAVPPDTGRSTFIMDENGNVLLGHPPATLIRATDLRRWATTDEPVALLRGSDGQQVTAARATIQPGTWSIVVEQPTDVAFSNSRRNTWLLAAMLTITGGIVVGWVLMLARELTRPILQLRDGVQILGTGHLGDTISVTREDELGQLAREFNNMSERLAESQRAIEQRNARLSEGLALAHTIQRDLLPQGLPPGVGVTAQAASESANEIGGDFYTYVPLADGRLRLVVGDASGKGVAAALVMALTSSLVEIQARQSPSPAELLNRLNEELYPRFSTSHMCVALLVAEFDPLRQELCVANAGMISPLIAEDDACTYIPIYGPPLGVVEHVTYNETTIELTPAQSVVFISDGIVEARDAAHEMWGFQRFEQVVCAAAMRGPDGIVADVLRDVKQHAGATPAADDLTIIAAALAPILANDESYALVSSAERHASSLKPRC